MLGVVGEQAHGGGDGGGSSENNGDVRITLIVGKLKIAKDTVKVSRRRN